MSANKQSPVVEISVKDAIVKQKDSLTFTVQTAESRFLFKADDSAAASIWVSALSNSSVIQSYTGYVQKVSVKVRFYYN